MTRAIQPWASRLGTSATIHSAIAPANSAPGGAVLVLRDPDNIQLELFVDPAHPAATES
jgi:glyoxylase I family protein